MKRRFSQLEAEWGVLAFCAWQSADLLTAWRHSPFDRLGWLALVLWLTPTLAGALPKAERRPKSEGRNPNRPRPRVSVFGYRISAFFRPSTSSGFGLQNYLAWLGLLICLAGMLTNLHVLNHVALALAGAAVTPRFAFRWLWLGLALAWMPVLGWLLRELPASGVAPIRLGLAALAAAIGWAELRHKFRRTLE
ncbi:MAG: hypothetical protein WCQ21_01585 [Verrucomicrobiota bacterium]